MSAVHDVRWGGSASDNGELQSPTTPNLDDLLASSVSIREKASGLPAEVQAARTEETRRRNTTASKLATKALRRLYADDYHSLIKQARAKIDAERGPLPGDDLIGGKP